MADLRHLEELAEVSGRPMIYNALRSTDSRPEGHRYIIKWLENCHARGLRIYPQAITTDAGLTFDLSEDLNHFRRLRAVVRGDAGQCRGQAAQAGRPGSTRGVAR